MSTPLRKKTLLLLFLILTGTVILGYAIYTGNESTEYEQLNTRHEQVIRASAGLFSSFQKADLDIFRNLVTHGVPYSAQSSNDRRSIHLSIGELRKLTRNDPVQQAIIDSIDRVARQAGDLTPLRGSAPGSGAIPLTSINPHGTNDPYSIVRINPMILALQHQEDAAFKQKVQNYKDSQSIYRLILLTLLFTVTCLVTLLFIVMESIKFQDQENQLAVFSRLERRFNFIHQILRHIISAGRTETFLQDCCKTAVTCGSYQMSWIGTIDRENDHTTGFHQYGVTDEARQEFDYIHLLPNTPQLQVLDTGTHYVNNNILINTTQECWVQFAIEQSVRSVAVLPIEKSGRVIGTFNLYSDQVDFFDIEEVQLLLDTTKGISLAMNILDQIPQNNLISQLVGPDEKRFRALIEKSSDMLMLSDANGRILYGNSSITKTLGYQPDEFLNKFTVEFMHPDSHAGYLRNRNEIVASSGNTIYYQERVRHKNGDWIWCEASGKNMLDEPGVNAIVTSFRDISEKKLEEQRREFDKNNLSALINSTYDLMWSVDRQLNLITCNDPFKKALQSASGEYVKEGDNFLQKGLAPELIASYRHFYEEAFSGKSFMEVRNRQDHWSEVSFCPIYLGRTVIGVACHSRDITKRKQLEKKLIESEKKYREIVETAQEGIWMIDADNITVFVNKKMCEILGYEEAEMIGKSVFFFKDELGKKVTLKHIARRRQGIRETDETIFITKDGKPIWTQLSANPIHDENGIYIGALAMITDISERRKMIDDLRLRNIGLEQFAYITSHNLRAPVANIIGASKLLQESGLSKDEELTLNEGIYSSVMRLDSVIKDLNLILEVKREINSTKEIVNLSNLVEDIKMSVGNQIDAQQVAILYDFTTINQLITLKPYLYSIFYNLISNSIKYRQPGIQCLIEIKSCLVGEESELTFKDNGMGIDLAKNSDQVFGLYKRFHSHIEGKGMGLFMVKTQVEALAGRITIESTKGRGTIFKIYLPSKHHL